MENSSSSGVSLRSALLRPFFLFVILFFAIFIPGKIWLRAHLAAKFPPAAPLRPGVQVTSFTLPDMAGATHTLEEYLAKNDFVMLHFWATWCPSCNEEMPTVVELYRELSPRGVEVVAISADRSVEDLEDYLEKNNLPFPVLRDETGNLMDKYNVTYIPTTLLVAKDGRLVAQNNDITKLKQAMEQWLRR